MEYKEFINLQIDEDPTITLKCLVQKVYDNFHIEIGT